MNDEKNAKTAEHPLDLLVMRGSGDHRCYTAAYGIPTVQLGDGGVIISDLFFEGDEFAGVGFSLGAGEIDQRHPELEGQRADEIGVFLQVISTAPESLQVLINRLEEVKQEWEYRTGAKMRPNTRSA